jgi:hypothetical protein
MDLTYYLNYIVTWFYHNVLDTSTTYSIVKVLIIVGLVSLLVYQQYIIFVLLCIIVVSAEFLLNNDNGTSGIKDLFAFNGAGSSTSSKYRREVDKDELTTGVSLTREGFSLGMPKIIKGDDTGSDYRRSNKFIEEDSRDFTEKYFSSKQCSIGSGAGAITMFGDNELIGSRGESYISNIYSLYDFSGNSTSNDSSGDPIKRLKYFNECVFEPIKRNDFREFKKELYTNMNQYVIDISKCLIRFDVPLLLNTKSDITRDISRRVSLSDKNANDQQVNDVAYVSIIQGNTNAIKLENIQRLNGGAKGDNASDTTYAELMKRTNDRRDGIYNEIAIRQRAIDIYGKAFGIRKRIDEILARMREETKNDASNLHTIRVNESIVNEMRRMLAYFALIQQCHSIIIFEQTLANIYAKLDVVPPLTTLEPISVTSVQIAPISGNNNLFRIPFYDDSYNTNDEKRYLYGITYYFDKAKSETPY